MCLPVSRIARNAVMKLRSSFSASKTRNTSMPHSAAWCVNAVTTSSA
jgi:hypothetical protein